MGPVETKDAGRHGPVVVHVIPGAADEAECGNKREVIAIRENGRNDLGRQLGDGPRADAPPLGRRIHGDFFLSCTVESEKNGCSLMLFRANVVVVQHGA